MSVIWQSFRGLPIRFMKIKKMPRPLGPIRVFIVLGVKNRHMSKISLLFAGCAFFLIATHAQAQVRITVNVGAQPEWGPTGYDRVDYYYLPDIETYYYVPRRQFIYLDGGRWVFATSLPARCSGYDLYRGYKVVVNEPRPWMRHNVYRARYVQYRNCYDRQPVLRDHRHRRDDDGPGHGHGKGHAYGHYKNHGKDDDD